MFIYLGLFREILLKLWCLEISFELWCFKFFLFLVRGFRCSYFYIWKSNVGMIVWHLCFYLFITTRWFTFFYILWDTNNLRKHKLVNIFFHSVFCILLFSNFRKWILGRWRLRSRPSWLLWFIQKVLLSLPNLFFLCSWSFRFYCLICI